MKPESWPVAEETHWKTWKFKDIITEAFEADSLRLRKDLASFEEKFSHQERLHVAVKSELDTERAHKATLQKALENAHNLVKKSEKEASHLRKLLRDLYRQKDRLKVYVQRLGGSVTSVHDDQSGILARFRELIIASVAESAPSMSVGRAWAFDGDAEKKPPTSGLYTFSPLLTSS